MKKKITPTNFSVNKSDDAISIVHDCKYKANNFMPQLKQVISAFYARPTKELLPPVTPMYYGKTMLQVAHETGIERASICRRVAELREANKIYALGKTICPISKERAMFYTTNPHIALSYFTSLTLKLIEQLPCDLQVDAIKAIKHYVVEGIDPILVSNDVQVLWNTSIKPIIDKERK